MEMLRLIREVAPSKPSAKLSSSAELPAIAAKRKLEAKRLTRLVHGDLDWIVMKCLEKERGRRYETADGLARDVQRYLLDEAVLASISTVLNSPTIFAGVVFGSRKAEEQQFVAEPRHGDRLIGQAGSHQVGIV
jgi:hypothetical protein